MGKRASHVIVEKFDKKKKAMNKGHPTNKMMTTQPSRRSDPYTIPRSPGTILKND